MLPLPLPTATVPAHTPRRSPGFVHYRVDVGTGIPVDGAAPGVKFNVTAVFSGAMQVADPEECDKDEQHAAVVTTNAYLASPYIVKATITTMHLSSNREVIGTPRGPKPVTAVSFYGARGRCVRYWRKHWGSMA